MIAVKIAVKNIAHVKKNQNHCKECGLIHCICVGTPGAPGPGGAPGTPGTPGAPGTPGEPAQYFFVQSDTQISLITGPPPAPVPVLTLPVTTTVPIQRVKLDSMVVVRNVFFSMTVGTNSRFDYIVTYDLRRDGTTITNAGATCIL